MNVRFARGRATRLARLALPVILGLPLTLLAGCGAGQSPPATEPTGAGGPSTPTAPPAPASTGTAASKEQAPGKPAPKRSRIEGDRQADLPSEPVVMSKQTEPSPFRFTDVTKQSGVDFVHFSGMTKDKAFPTANGSGVGLIDYDNDGKLDLYFCTATIIPVGSVTKGTNRLYRNLGGLKFEDVTEKAGVGFRGFCHGVIVGDLDNDGDQDLFLCNYGPNVLYLNNGDGTFKDVSKAAGVHRPALVGAVVPDKEAGATVTVGFKAGPVWSVGGVNSTQLRLKARKGTRVVFRQNDPESPHGLAFRNADAVQTLGGPEKPNAVLKEVGSGPSRVGQTTPPIKKDGEPAVVAEFEVVKDLEQPLPFYCTVFDRAWSSGGACIDYDNDGDLDLYVSNYGSWDFPDDDLFCGDVENKIRLYCSPRTVRTVRHFLYRNNGDGTFTDVYDQVIQTVDPETRQRKPRSDGHGFGVVTADLNDDGKVDIYVANDMNPNFLFLNKGDGTFEDATESSGAAYDEKGQAQSGMGIDAEDVDGDGLPELFVTNFANEYNTLYQNLGRGTFMDSTPFFGLAADSMPWVGWGTALADFDNDGWPDNFVVNGHVDDNRHELGQNVDYAEIPLLFANLKGKKFRLATREAGDYFDTKHVGRGAAFGDLDNDGDIDIVVNHKDGAPAILRNDSKHANHWLRVVTKGSRGNRDGLGAKVTVEAGGRKIVRQRKGGTSLESANDPRLTVGIGTADEAEKLTVRWPSGAVSTLEHVKADREVVVTEPKDAAPSTAAAAAGGGSR